MLGAEEKTCGWKEGKEMWIVFPTVLLYGDRMVWSGRGSTTDGIKVKASVRAVNSMTLCLCFALFLCFRCRFEQKKKKKVRKWDQTLWMNHDDRCLLKWTGCQVSDFSEHTSLFLNGSTWVPWSPRLHSEECGSWSLQLRRLPQQGNHARRIIQPGPESSQDISPTCRHRELWWFSGESCPRSLPVMMMDLPSQHLPVEVSWRRHHAAKSGLAGRTVRTPHLLLLV